MVTAAVRGIPDDPAWSLEARDGGELDIVHRHPDGWARTYSFNALERIRAECAHCGAWLVGPHPVTGNE